MSGVLQLSKLAIMLSVLLIIVLTVCWRSSYHFSNVCPCVSMGARRIFSRGLQIRGLGTKVLQRGPGMEPKWESRVELPEADDSLCK